MNTIIKTKEITYIELPRNEVGKYIYKITKRLIDICISLIGCVMLIPLTIIIWAANILNKEKGPVFYTHERVGKDGKIFKIYKFRTMCNNAEEMIKDQETMKKYFTPDQIREWKENAKISNDSRITKIGHFLRRASIDEFPQFINVLKGDLSLVGPRPVVQEELERYKENKYKFLSVTPGVTGYWTAHGRSNTSYEERMQMELYYVDNASLKLDIMIILKTVMAVIKRKGAM